MLNFENALRTDVDEMEIIKTYNLTPNSPHAEIYAAVCEYSLEIDGDDFFVICKHTNEIVTAIEKLLGKQEETNQNMLTFTQSYALHLDMLDIIEKYKLDSHTPSMDIMEAIYNYVDDFNNVLYDIACAHIVEITEKIENFLKNKQKTLDK